MSPPTPDDGTRVVAFQVYGTRASVSVPHPELVPSVVDQFPVHSTPCAPQPGDRRFELKIESDGRYAVLQDGRVFLRPPALKGALRVLRGRLFWHAMMHARDRLAVHAGVVGYEGRAIILPGPAAVGKTTLVRALLRAGALYYADDWALLDEDGVVHPYHSLLYVKNEGKFRAEKLGGVRGHRPIPVGVIAAITFRAGARWSPKRRTPAWGMLKLLRHTYGMDAPRSGMQAARRAAADAVVLEGERDDADEAAAGLIEIASDTTAQALPPGGSS